jgi:hypothetical protein
MAKIAIAVGAAAAGFLIAGPYGLSLGVAATVEAVSVGLSVGLAIDRIAFPHRTKLGMPIQDLQVSSSANGAPIPFGYSNNRFAGQLIWAPKITFITQHEPGQGGLFGGSGGGTGPSVYAYFASFAVSFGEGPGVLRRVWGDSKIIYKSPSATPGNFVPLGDIPAWDAGTPYHTDDVVLYPPLSPGVDSRVYQAIYPSIGVIPPGNSLFWEQSSDYPPWNRDTIYQTGALIDYFGQIYAASRPTQGSPPPGHGWEPLANYYAPPTIYQGDESQNPDPIIQAAEGIDNTPAFRGQLVGRWEGFPLANFGNRVPNIRGEVTFPLGHNA